MIVGVVIIVGIIGFVLLRRSGIIPISWEEAQKLVKNCQVASVFQTHGQVVSLTLRDGSERKTIEPQIDEIAKVTAEAEKKLRF